MPVSRLRALSAFSILRPGAEPGEVGLERERAAVGRFERDAFALQMAEQLEHQRAGEPGGMERDHALYAHRLLVDRRQLDRAEPLAPSLRPGATDARDQADFLAVLELRDHFERDDEIAHREVRKVMDRKSTRLNSSHEWISRM